ncbi:MAG TPA: nuclear transport factor 2 family protein [Phototrophicaceae bacterium]|nr:nuclear transport factor 2 family protein [Phototrophicaceae bacterium]
MNDQWEIAETVNRYFAALDERTLDVGTLRKIFADTATIVRPNGSFMTGPEELSSSHTESMARFKATQHLTSGFIIDLADGSNANFRVNLVAMHLWKEGSGDPNVRQQDNYFLAGGVVSGSAVKTGAGWRILTIRNDVVWRQGVGFQEVLKTK